ncbi:MAG: hypothetical protein OSA06_06650 [Acidimicrobiales bacterium]|nr:hypothetical protein [Acidimicrobiales bacterium]
MSNEALNGAKMSKKYLLKVLIAVLALTLVASACAGKDDAVNDAVTALEEAADALAVAQVAREEAEAVAAAAVAEAQAAAAAAAQAVADATAAAALAETGDAAAQAAAQAEADAAALAAELAEAAAAYAQEQADIAEAEAEAAALLAEAQAAAQAAEDEEETEDEGSGPSFGNLQPGVISPILPALTLPPIISLPPIFITCLGDESPTADYDEGPIWPARIDGDAIDDYASVGYGNDTGRWYLRVDSSYHGVTFWRDLGPDAGEVDFSIGYITDINVNDRAEIWVSSFDASGPHAPFAHVLYLLYGCALTPVGSNLAGSEDVLTVFLGQAVTGEAFYVSCSTFEGEPLFTYFEDYPVGPGMWAYRPLPFHLDGSTLNLVLDVALEGGIAAPPESITNMNCPNG